MNNYLTFTDKSRMEDKALESIRNTALRLRNIKKSWILQIRYLQWVLEEWMSKEYMITLMKTMRDKIKKAVRSIISYIVYEYHIVGKEGNYIKIKRINRFTGSVEKWAEYIGDAGF